MPMIKDKYNPLEYWGVPAWGLFYGNKTILDPSNTTKPLLSIIDSGTTLNLLPQTVFEGLMNAIANTMKNDTRVDIIC